MSPFWLHPAWNASIWPLTGLMATLLFFGAVVLIALSARFRRFGALAGSALLLALSYTVLQCVSVRLWNGASAPVPAFVRFFTAGHGLFPLALCLCMGVMEGLLLRFHRRRAADRVTPSSIKEAIDTLPSGVCFFREDGRVLLVNRVMEDLCRRLTGEALVNGARFCEALASGALPEGCQRADGGEEPLIVLPDGAAWSFSRRRLQDARLRPDMLVASDVTEIYEKTRALRRAREKVTALNRRLTDYNREIVAVTTAREILNAKVRIHNELGGNLLAIRRCLLEDGAPAGETDAIRKELVERLRMNVAFLERGETAPARDEYALMLETARTLGVDVRVEGEMPEWEPARHILAVAIHECFTNTLRHAHGGALFVRVARDDGRVRAEFTNDGEQPGGPIRERGGLRSLRALTERAGGRMEIRTSPAFTITLTLPKEDDHGLSSGDRG